MRVISLFADTNSFIHLRDLKDLPWRELFQEAECINILIASSVVQELDGLKINSNSRKRDRARLALKLIDEASASDDFSIILRTDPFKIRLIISRTTRLDWSMLPQLDPARPDDRLVAEAISHGDGAVIFSYDSGPLIRARIAKIRAVKPPEAWWLPNEKTDDQRKITQLERDLQRALNPFPSIVLNIGSADNEATELGFEVPKLSPLGSDAAERFVKAYLTEHPKTFVMPNLNRFTLQLGSGYSEYDAQKYNESYADFEVKVREYFSNLHLLIERGSHAVPVSYSIKNDSIISARGLRIEARLLGEAYLVADDEDAASMSGSLIPPEPPDKPKRRNPGFDYLESPFIHQRNFASQNALRDPTAFNWIERPKYEVYSSLHCDDFRATRVWESYIWIWVNSSLPFSGEIALHVDATNLPAPVNVSVAITLTEHDAQWSDDHVLAMLPGSVRKFLT